MSRPNPRSRRDLLWLGGTAMTSAVLAGCTEGGGDPDENDPEDELEEEAQDEADPPEDDWDDEWGDVDTIELEADEDGWVGRRPSVIADVENPDLALYEGAEYEFVWTNRDGDSHNLAFWDDNDSPLTRTPFVDDADETETFAVETTEEMALYLCEAHGEEMVGSIEIRSE